MWSSLSSHESSIEEKDFVLQELTFPPQMQAFEEVSFSQRKEARARTRVDHPHPQAVMTIGEKARQYRIVLRIYSPYTIMIIGEMLLRQKYIEGN